VVESVSELVDREDSCLATTDFNPEIMSVTTPDNTTQERSTGHRTVQRAEHRPAVCAARRDWSGLVRRGLRKPPRIILARLLKELNTEADRFLLDPRFARRAEALPGMASDHDANRLWQELAARPYVAQITLDDEARNAISTDERTRILLAAEAGIAHRVDLLGSGPLALGATIDWQRDYKSGIAWPTGYALRMQYADPNRPSDVKIPWEISRLQWLIPVGQAYLLTGEERYAAAVREILESWIDANPYAYSVNWACTMEVALRILSWTWLFHVFQASDSWRDAGFRRKLLGSLYQHGKFTSKYLERSDINGNHYTANAAGLVFAGLFFGSLGQAPRWQQQGWEILLDELPKQVDVDGVDFEASIAYHRLVQELFLLPALYREAQHFDVPKPYRERVIAMTRFTQAYSRSDGSVPLVGDADDARALPLGGQAINDHRYLLALVGSAWDVADLRAAFSGPREEILWLLGSKACEQLPDRRASFEGGSKAFVQGGFYVMRNERDHVFIDAGPVGLAGRGGHGHNDCLAYEAMLDGVPLVSDCGAYLYTASYAERNHFRSTVCHNTPCINGEEINRFLGPNDLWTLRNDARPDVRRWRTSSDHDVLTAAHSGYQRMAVPVTPVRTIVLAHARHALVVLDQFETAAPCELTIETPLHLAAGVRARQESSSSLLLEAGERRFLLSWEGLGWELTIGRGRISPSYGVAVECCRLAWRYAGPAETSLLLCIAPLESAEASPLDWSRHVLAEAINSEGLAR
jgi:hypothetical protein